MVPIQVSLICIYTHIYIGVENGNLFQYSCMENSMDRGACTLQSMRSQSRTWLSMHEHTWKHVWVYTHTHICVCVYVYMYVYMCVCRHTYMLVCILMCGQLCPTLTHIYIYIYIYIKLSLCVCIYIPAATFERKFEFTFN